MKKQRTFKILISLSLLLLLIMTGCVQDKGKVQDVNPIEDDSGQPTETESTEGETSEGETTDEESNILQIGVVNYPPFYYIEDGEITGPTVETASEAFDRMNVKYEFKEYPWARVLEMMKSGELDVIIDLYLSDERMEFIDYSVEKAITHSEALFKLADSDIEFDGNYSTLNELTIGIVQGYYYGDDFDKAVKDGAINVEDVASSERNITKLINGRTDLIVDNVAINKVLIEKLGYSGMIVPLKPYINSEDSYTAFSKANNLKDIRDKFDETIRQMREDGTIDAIYGKYGVDEY